jgi:RimJ/RimL family protein N-acetyltransferase
MIELKPLDHLHGGAIQTLMNDDICKHLGCGQMTTVERVLSYIYAPASTQPMRFAIHHPAIGIVGVVSFGRLKEVENAAVIGYWVGQPYQGNGFARKGLIELFKLLNQFQITKVCAEVFPENRASYRLLEGLGFNCPNPSQLINNQLQYHMAL